MQTAGDSFNFRQLRHETTVYGKDCNRRSNIAPPLPAL